METKAIKCSCCGAAYEGDIQDGFFVCNHCNTKSKIVEDNITIQVEDNKIEDEIKLEDGPATAVKEKTGKRRIIALAAAVALLTSGITGAVLRSKSGKVDNDKPKTIDVTQLNIDEIQNVADYVTNEFLNGNLSLEGAAYLLKGAGIDVDPNYFDNLYEAYSDQMRLKEYEEKLDKEIREQNGISDPDVEVEIPEFNKKVIEDARSKIDEKIRMTYNAYSNAARDQDEHAELGNNRDNQTGYVEPENVMTMSR